MTRGKRPVTLLSGFLGSGKTTLLRHTLAVHGAGGVAVVINEVGQVGLDNELVRQTGERVALVSGGCVCCSRREDLVAALRELLDLDQRGAIAPLRRVVIEASGLADPAPILFSLVTDPVLQHHFYVDAIISTVDAVNGGLHVELHEETRKQIAVADELILTKVDMATPTDVAALAERLRAINPGARVVEAVFGRVEGGLILDGEPARERLLREFIHTGAEPIAGSHAHNTQALSLTFDVPLDWIAFGVWLSMLLESRGQDVLRVKGLVDVREVGPVVINGVQHVIHPPEHLEVWPSEDKRSRLVFITRNIDPKTLRRSLEVFQRIGDPTWRSRLAG